MAAGVDEFADTLAELVHQSIKPAENSHLEWLHIWACFSFSELFRTEYFCIDKQCSQLGMTEQVIKRRGQRCDAG